MELKIKGGKEFAKLSELKGWDRNPRGIKKDDFERLKRQIERLGQYKPLLVNSDGVVLGGNMRMKAFGELKIDEVWVSVVDAETEQKMVEYALSDNDRSGFYQEESLAELIASNPGIDLEEFKVDLGHALTIGEVLNNFSPEYITEDEPPEVDSTPAISKLGEIYQLGRHRLSCGDSTSIDVMKALMDGKSAAMTFTDPPYNVNYGATMKDKLRHKVSKGNAGRKILNDHFDDHEDFYNFLFQTITSMKNFVRGDVYVCMSSSELHTLQKAFVECGGHWSTFIIWVKNTFTIGRSNYQRQYEPILYGWFEGSSHFWSGTRKLSDVYKEEIKEMDGAKWLKLEAGVETDIWEYNKPTKSKEHPTMKPIALCARAIKNSSKVNDIVLDQFGGSGSTLIACEQLNRSCHINELDPKYVDVIRKRYAKFIGDGDRWEEITPVIKEVE